MLSDGFAARALGGFAAAAPEVRVSMIFLPADEMVRRLLAGAVDLVLTAGPIAEAPAPAATQNPSSPPC